MGKLSDSSTVVNGYCMLLDQAEEVIANSDKLKGWMSSSQIQSRLIPAGLLSSMGQKSEASQGQMHLFECFFFNVSPRGTLLGCLMRSLCQACPQIERNLTQRLSITNHQVHSDRQVATVTLYLLSSCCVSVAKKRLQTSTGHLQKVPCQH